MSDLTNAEKRAIWMECHNWEMSVSRDAIHLKLAEKEALRRYPDPYEPKIVKTTSGFEFRIIDDGHVEYRNPGHFCWQRHPTFTAADLLKLGQIAHEYSERTK